MPGIYLAAPGQVPPLPEVPPHLGVGVALRGYDGTAFNLTGPGSGVRLLRGVRGFNKPPHERFTSTSPVIAGSRQRGTRVQEREVSLQLFVYKRGESQEWIAHDDAFWSIMDRDRPLSIDVTQPNGTVRTLEATFKSDNDHTWDMLPVKAGWARYNVVLVADRQPFWTGPPITRSWDSGAGSDWESFLGDDFVMTISQGPTVNTAKITNPGDVPAYPVWTLSGPMSGASVGAYDASGNPRQITVAHSLALGENLVIDPRPTAQSAIHSVTGENWVRDPAKITNADFNGSEIPPGTDVNLATIMAGEGTISASLTPLYDRAW